MDANVKLSTHELNLVMNADWILTKQAIIQKVIALMGQLSERFDVLRTAFADTLPEELNEVSPKVYKGEQYRLLPYVLLDNPRYFKGGDVFAIRNMFWWGNYFSIHLHLGGKFKTLYQDKIILAVEKGELDDWYLAVNESPWEHHFEADNYLPVNVIKQDVNAVLAGQNFIKLAQKYPLQEWELAASFFEEKYRAILEVLD